MTTKTNSLEKLFVVERAITGALESIRVAGTNGEVIKTANFNEAKAFLSAAIAYHRFGDYDNPLTGIGMHLKKDVSLKAIHENNVGSIAIDYAGDALFAPNADICGENGWATINLRRGTVRYSPLTSEYHASYHDAYDYLQLGYTLDITVPESGQELFETMLMTALEPDTELAFQMREDGYERARTKAYLDRDIKRGRVNKEWKPNVLEAINGASVIVTFEDGEQQPLEELKTGRYTPVDAKGKALNPVLWDQTPFAKSRFQRAQAGGITFRKNG